ncbi:MAG: hypothetical protein QWI36_04970 [Wolbachia endosymbiont of Tyrophagus putrescentiae]|nr:hypothetical protein [Wolbachia endosymbiont of Tyrophagus putrescentiae]
MQQEDIINCGVFALRNAWIINDNLRNGSNIEAIESQLMYLPEENFDINDVRRRFAESVRDYYKSPNSGVCPAPTPPPKECKCLPDQLPQKLRCLYNQDEHTFLFNNVLNGIHYYTWLRDQDISNIAEIVYGWYSESRALLNEVAARNFSESEVLYETIIPTQLLEMLEKNIKKNQELNKRRSLTYFINLDNNHWVTLVVTNERNILHAYYINSSGGEINSIVQKALRDIGININNIHNFNIMQQEDIINCGVFALRNAWIINDNLRNGSDIEVIRSRLMYHQEKDFNINGVRIEFARSVKHYYALHPDPTSRPPSSPPTPPPLLPSSPPPPSDEFKEELVELLLEERVDEFKERFQSFLNQILDFSVSAAPEKSEFYYGYFLGMFGTLKNTKIYSKFNVQDVSVKIDRPHPNSPFALHFIIKRNGLCQIFVFTTSKTISSYKKSYGYKEDVCIVQVKQKTKKEKGSVPGVEVTGSPTLGNHTNLVGFETIPEIKKSTQNKAYEKLEDYILGVSNTKNSKESVDNIVQYNIDLYTEIKKLLIHDNKISKKSLTKLFSVEAFQHGFFVGGLVNCRHRHNLKAYVEIILGRGKADLLFQIRGKERFASAEIVVCEFKKTSENIKTVGQALNEARWYVRGLRPNKMRMIPDSKTAVLVGLDLNHGIYESEKCNIKSAASMPFLQSLLTSMSNGRMDDVKSLVSDVYYLFPRTESSYKYLDRFVFAQSLIVDEVDGIKIEEKMVIKHGNNKELTSFVFKIGKKLLIFNINNNQREASNTYGRIDIESIFKEQARNIENVIEVNINAYYSRKKKDYPEDHFNSNNFYYVSCLMETYLSFGNAVENSRYSIIANRGVIKESFNGAMNYQHRELENRIGDNLPGIQEYTVPLGTYEVLLNTISEELYKNKEYLLSEMTDQGGSFKEYQFKALLDGMLTGLSDISYNEEKGLRVIVVTEFQVGEGSRGDIVIQTVDKEDSNVHGVPVLIELKSNVKGIATGQHIGAKGQLAKYLEKVGIKAMTDGKQVAGFVATLNMGGLQKDQDPSVQKLREKHPPNERTVKIGKKKVTILAELEPRYLIIIDDHFIVANLVHSSMCDEPTRQRKGGGRRLLWNEPGMLCIDSRDKIFDLASTVLENIRSNDKAKSYDNDVNFYVYAASAVLENMRLDHEAEKHNITLYVNNSTILGNFTSRLDEVLFLKLSNNLVLLSDGKALLMQNYYTMNEYILPKGRIIDNEEAFFEEEARSLNYIIPYLPNERILQIYHNQPINKRAIGVINFRYSSILDFDIKVIGYNLLLLYSNNAFVKVENWGINEHARKMMFTFSDAIVSNLKCIASVCNSEDAIVGIIKEFNSEKVMSRIRDAIVRDSINNEDSNGRTILHIIAQEGDLTSAMYLVSVLNMHPYMKKEFWSFINKEDKFGFTPLQYAKDKCDMINLFLSQVACNGDTSMDLIDENHCGDDTNSVFGFMGDDSITKIKDITNAESYSNHTRNHRAIEESKEENVASSASRPRSVINDLVGWVKDSVSELFNSSLEAEENGKNVSNREEMGYDDPIQEMEFEYMSKHDARKCNSRNINKKNKLQHNSNESKEQINKDSKDLYKLARNQQQNSRQKHSYSYLNRSTDSQKQHKIHSQIEKPKHIIDRSIGQNSKQTTSNRQLHSQPEKIQITSSDRVVMGKWTERISTDYRRMIGNGNHTHHNSNFNSQGQRQQKSSSDFNFQGQKQQKPISQVTAQGDVPGGILLAVTFVARAMNSQKNHTPPMSKKVQKGVQHAEKVRAEALGLKVGGRINGTLWYQ